MKFFVRPVPNDEEDSENVFELGWISRFGYLEIIQFVLNIFWMKEFIDQTGHLLACYSCDFPYVGMSSSVDLKKLICFFWDVAVHGNQVDLKTSLEEAFEVW